MELGLKEQLLGFKDELTHFQSDDILVHLHMEKVLEETEWVEPHQAKAQRILREAQRIYREIGVQAFCQSKGVMRWEQHGKQLETPIYLSDVPLEFKKSSILPKVEFEAEYYLNPYFDRWFRSEFNTTPPCFEKREQLSVVLATIGHLYLDEISFFGNFHPQRYELLKEVDELLLCEDISEPLQQLLGHSELPEEKDNWSFQAPYLFPYDPDQQLVFEAINHSSVTVQGPPGTGKSQVISNLIGSCISQNKNVLIVSEKKAALNVLQQKLEQKNLGFLCSHVAFHSNSNAYYSDLKATWEFLSQQEISQRINFPTLDAEVRLKQIFEGFKQFESECGVSILDVKKQVSKSVKKSHISSPIPSFKTWKKDESLLHQLQKNTLTCLPFLGLTWKEPKNFSNNVQQLTKLLNTHDELSHLFRFERASDIQLAVREAVLCHQFQGNIYEKYGRFLGKDLNLIKKSLKKWKQVCLEIEDCEADQNHWMNEPSFAELEVLKKAAQEHGFFAELRWKKLWKKWTRTPGLDPIKSILSKENHLSLIQAKNKIALTFADLGIVNSDVELPIIEQMLQHNSLDDWNWYQALAPEKRIALAAANLTISTFNQSFQQLFTIVTDAEIGTILSITKDAISSIQQDIALLQELSEKTFQALKFEQDLAALNGHINQHTWQTFISVHPNMVDFEVKSFKEQVEKQLKARRHEENDFSRFLIHHQAKKFAQFQHILSAPLKKLSTEEKEMRGILRKGKSILVKEFAKTRQHLSIRELRKSEARLWIDVLKPIQLSNPSSLASIYPMETGQFDLLIFDEAGQIPMSYALGALQRAKRVVVAGDHQQMSPSSYFKKSDDVVVDVLHQSAFYFKNILLTRHYRSRNPQLIAFSNDHFYGGRLRTFADRSQTKNPVTFTYVSTGIYENRVNLTEAKIVAKLIEKALSAKEKYGIVAFSEAQLSAIHSCLSARHQVALNEAIHEDRIFFKALEQVQGEECDHLLISFGYGKNPEGKFELRFGPLNLMNGAKRLNVLFSRARMTIQFVASITSSDFTSSKNEGVQRIMDWFVFAENQQELFNSEISQEKSFEELLNEEEDFLSFSNRFDVLRQRGWTLH
ncbi:MAG: ATP-binding protein [Crocinitomicaceae bacterium]|nr:ATP-binding protein [Crocinitomicaceae bacterium]MBP6033031.1 ATP-binding protein [Crocinitomicaceae bacterium]